MIEIDPVTLRFKAISSPQEIFIPILSAFPLDIIEFDAYTPPQGAARADGERDPHEDTEMTLITSNVLPILKILPDEFTCQS